MFQNTIRILFGVVLAVQLTGCFFVDRDHREHRDHHEYHGHDHDDAVVDVHLHN